VLEHPRFTKERNDVHIRVPLTSEQFENGCSVTVPLPTGEKLDVSVRPDTKPESLHLIFGKGVHTQPVNGNFIIHWVSSDSDNPQSPDWLNHLNRE
jgi:DnaJ-class molecular chaperone